MGGDQGLAGYLRPHRSVAQDEVRQDGEDRFAGGALDAPEGETTQTEAGVMRVARQAPTAATGGLVGELKPKREDERQDKLDKRSAIAEYLEVGRFIAEINGDGAVVAGRLGAVSHVSPSVEMAIGVEETS